MSSLRSPWMPSYLRSLFRLCLPFCSSRRSSSRLSSLLRLPSPPRFSSWSSRFCWQRFRLSWWPSPLPHFDSKWFAVIVCCRSYRSDSYNVRPTVQIDFRYENLSPRPSSSFSSWIVIERREWSSRCNSFSPRGVGLSVVRPFLPLRFGPTSTHIPLPYRQCHIPRPPAFEFCPARLSAIGAFASDEATLVRASHAKRCLIRRDYYRLRPPQSFRALTIWLKRSRVRRLAVVGAFAQPVCHSRRRTSRVETRSGPHFPRRCGPRSDEILRTTAGAGCESFKKIGLEPSWCISFVFLPPDRHVCLVVTALPSPHAAFPGLQPSFFSEPLPSHSSVPFPMPSLPFAHKLYTSLAFPYLSLPCSMPSMLPSTSHSYPNAVAGSPGTQRIERHCWKPHRDSALQRHRVSKLAHFKPTPS